MVGGGGGAAKAKATLEGHVSVVRGIDITSDGRWMVSAGRDKVVLVWDMGEDGGEAAKGKGKGKGRSTDGPRTVQTIIAGEQVESVGLLPVGEEALGQPKGRLRCWTGGDKGVVRVWDAFKAELVGQVSGVEGVDEAEMDEDEQRGIISVL
jgi:U3 small nucleolar RNA-associated protein 13